MNREGIISIHPEFAGKILMGQKTVEFRKRSPDDFLSASRLWIYATLPVGGIVGAATIEYVSCASPDEIWNRYHLQGGIIRKEYDAYFDGSSKALAFCLSNVFWMKKISLYSLRKAPIKIEPPQNMMRITRKNADYFLTYAMTTSISNWIAEGRFGR